MAGNLKARLKRIREAGKEGMPPGPGSAGALAARGAADASAAGKGGSGLPPCLASWREVGEFVHDRELVFPCVFPEEIDAAPFRSLKAARESQGAESMTASSLRFFDLETTGLSGGSGTVAFLAAMGRLEAGRLTVRQLFLADYPGEGLFLEALLDDFTPGINLVTYNGKAFDLPLLRTRCVMNGIAPPSPPHLDLLFAARRLWKRPAGGASLGLLESFVLGRERGEDVPGALIPAIWLDFVRGGGAPQLGAVLSHNAEDVASLALLLARAAAVFRNPSGAQGREGVDLAGLGRGLLALGREGEGEPVLEAAAEAGDEAAAIALARRYARQRRVADRARMVALLGDSAAAELERAKYLEHVERDFGAALACVDRARKALGGGSGAGTAAAARLAEGLCAREERLRARLSGGEAEGGA